MSWQQWTLVAWHAFNALAVVSAIGEPRKPVTPRTAVIALVLAGVLAALVVTS